MLIDYLVVIIICFLICRKLFIALTREEAYFFTRLEWMIEAKKMQSIEVLLTKHLLA